MCDDQGTGDGWPAIGPYDGHIAIRLMDQFVNHASRCDDYQLCDTRFLSLLYCNINE